jgi:hypothetical protein
MQHQLSVVAMKAFEPQVLARIVATDLSTLPTRRQLILICDFMTSQHAHSVKLLYESASSCEACEVLVGKGARPPVRIIVPVNALTTSDAPLSPNGPLVGRLGNCIRLRLDISDDGATVGQCTAIVALIQL